MNMFSPFLLCSFLCLFVQCSVTCGRGNQARFIKCAEKVCIISVMMLTQIQSNICREINLKQHL